MSRLLRVATAGGVEDGKSTLIGRLVYDAKALVGDSADEPGREHADPALPIHGSRAEREQGITIDVAYRYFATPRRRFIVADTPGHVQYTRNMVTGASTADLALILVDARYGVVEQTKRHAFLSSLLGIPHLILCVNKMDLVGWSQERFDAIRSEFETFAAKLEVSDLTFVPMSALDGDNVVHRSSRMDWYEGGSLLHHLEGLHIESDRNLIDARFPVQYVIRREAESGEHADFRGYAGTVASGIFKVGDEVVVLPSGRTTEIAAVWGPGGDKVEQGTAQSALCIELAGDVDVARGDMLARPNNRPLVGTDIDAMICWLSDDAELRADARYVLMHTTASTVARVEELRYRLDVDTLHRDDTADSLVSSDIGRVRIKTHRALLFDPYRRNRITGSFLLVDEGTGATVAAGMITGPALSPSNIVWHSSRVAREERQHRGATVWITGLSGSGKSTVATELERQLIAAGRPAYVLDGDNLRHGLNSDLGFDATSRAENVRRVGAVAQIVADAGLVAIACLISPYRAQRDTVREMHERAGLPFYEVFVDTPLVTCEARDPKGMYARARAGEITGFTGVDDPYEVPTAPDVVLCAADGDPAAQAARIVRLLTS